MGGRTLALLALAAFLAACTNDGVIEPPAPIGNADESLGERSLAAEFSPPEEQAVSSAPLQPAAPALAAQQMPSGATTPVMAAASSVRLQFAPVVGAPAEELAPLNQRLMQRAAERGIAVSMGGDPSANYVVKGYFSTLKEAGGNTLIFVWDVFDRNGARVHRIQGKETALGQGAPTALRSIADRTMDDLAGWLASREG